MPTGRVTPTCVSSPRLLSHTRPSHTSTHVALPGAGCITTQELGTVLRAVGKSPTDAEVAVSRHPKARERAIGKSPTDAEVALSWRGGESASEALSVRSGQQSAQNSASEARGGEEQGGGRLGAGREGRRWVAEGMGFQANGVGELIPVLLLRPGHPHIASLARPHLHIHPAHKSLSPSPAYTLPTASTRRCRKSQRRWTQTAAACWTSKRCGCCGVEVSSCGRVCHLSGCPAPTRAPSVWLPRAHPCAICLAAPRPPVRHLSGCPAPTRAP
eukprot:365298-Chlamydomonas_euryale.AAC.1